MTKVLTTTKAKAGSEVEQIKLVIVDDCAYVDSRDLAKRLCNAHRSSIALIDKYPHKFERLAKVRFKKAPSPVAFSLG